MNDRRAFLSGSACVLLAGPCLANDDCKGSKLVANSSSRASEATIVGSAVAPGARNPWEIAAAVGNAFQANIESNFRRMPTEELQRLLSTMSDAELHDLAFCYRQATLNSATAPRLLEHVASRADMPGLVRVGTFFGFADTYAAIVKASPVQASAFALQLAPRAVGATSLSRIKVLEDGPAAGAKPSPTIDLTIRQIYLDYRTAPVGSLSVKAALYETASFAGTRLSFASTVGYGIGTVINSLWSTYAPESYNASSNLLGRSVDGFVNSVSTLLNGISLDNVSFNIRLQIGASQMQLFGSGAFGDLGPSKVFYRNGGDFNVSSPWSDMMDSGCK